MRSLASWSAGKDSCLAVLRARELGHRVEHLLTMFDPTSDLSKSHGLSEQLVVEQAAAMQCALTMPKAGWTDYEAVFVSALEALRDDGLTHVVFGDIDLQAHRDWEETVSARAGLVPVLPLWLEPRPALAQEVLDRGIQATVACVDHRYLDASFVGRPYDRQFLDDLPDGVDACGENGEFHTFVWNAPGFTHPVRHHVSGTRSYTAPAEYGGVSYTFAVLDPG